MIGNPYQKYQNNNIMTATPQELTLMLYNGAIKFCNQAIEALDNNKIEASHIALVKAQKIIEELQITLDKKYPVAYEIEELYSFIIGHLKEANINKDKTKVIEALGLIRDFKDLWQEVMKIAK